MNKIEITINKADELITALTRLTEALEVRATSAQVKIAELNEVVEKEQPPQIEPPTKHEKTVTLEQIRAVLTAKSQAGKKAAIQGLFKKYDADKLTAVDPSRYIDLLNEAEKL